MDEICRDVCDGCTAGSMSDGTSETPADAVSVEASSWLSASLCVARKYSRSVW